MLSRAIRPHGSGDTSMRMRTSAFFLTALALVGFGSPNHTALAGGGGGGIGSVPDVVGRSKADATAALAAEGYLVGIYEIAGDPPDTVASQTPAANVALPRGGIVSLDVRRKEADPTPAPRAIGLATSAAVAAFGRLYDLHFEATVGTAAERGKVREQSPAEGQPLALKGRWTLRYVPDPSLPPTVALPDVTGATATQAVDALGAVGLHGQIVEASIPGAPVDLVIGQFPLPGSEVLRESDVRVVVTVPFEGGAVPAGRPEVPNVVGLSESAAKDALDRAGFDSSVEYVAGAASDAFLVVTQQPDAGAEAPEGTVLALRIVKYLAPAPVVDGVSMPNLVGLSAWQAEDLLVSIGLRASPILMDNPSVPPLRVFAQQRAVGSLVPSGTSVSYRVSRPAATTPSVVVPDLYQRSAASAIALCAQAGVSVTIVEILTNTYPAWRVFSQSLAAYSLVPAGTNVIARVAKPSGGGGPTTTIVPDLTGRTAGEATALLTAAGLSVGLIDVVSPGNPPLKVFAQFPAAGAQVSIGALVQAKIAKLSFGWKLVPSLFGMTKPEAFAALAAAGLQPNAVDIANPAKPLGKVFWQDTVAGTSRPAGTVITFRVAKAALVPVPYLIGKTDAQAASLLVASGLDWKRSYKFAPPGSPYGRVFEQTIGAGASVMPGTQVEFFLPGGALPPAVALVPTVLGKTKINAQAILQAFGFPSQVVEVVGPLPHGIVFLQSPAAGTGANVGTIVTITVRKSPFIITSVAVPNLIGLTGDQANAALFAVGLASNGSIAFHFGKPPYKVYSQNYIPGTMVAVGTQITWRRNVP